MPHAATPARTITAAPATSASSGTVASVRRALTAKVSGARRKTARRHAEEGSVSGHSTSQRTQRESAPAQMKGSSKPRTATRRPVRSTALETGANGASALSPVGEASRAVSSRCRRRLSSEASARMKGSAKPRTATPMCARLRQGQSSLRSCWTSRSRTSPMAATSGPLSRMLS